MHALSRGRFSAPARSGPRRRPAVALVSMLAIPALILLGAPTLAAAEELPDSAASADTLVVDPAADEGTDAAATTPPAPDPAVPPAEEPAPPAEEVPPPAPVDPPDAAVEPETDAPAAPDPQAPATVPEADAPPAPIDCMAIPIANDDRSERDTCLAAQQASMRTMAAAWPYDEPAANPDLPDVCGLDMAFILDKSGSIGDAGIANLKDAADAFSGALVDTGSEVSVTSFDQDASVLLGATELSGGNVGTVQGSYSGLSSDGWTNWKRGLEVGLGTFGGFTDGPVELTIVITDGNPNTVDPSDGGEFPDGSPDAVNPAIAQANDIKAAGSHVLVIAVGGSVSLQPIEAISGPEAFDGTNITTADYLTTTDYSTLADSLKEVAIALCGGSVVIDKTVNGQPAEGWEFSTSDADVTPASQQTAADGMTDPYDVSGYGDADTRAITFTEEDRPYWEMAAVSCEVGGDDRPVTLVGDHGWTVDVGKFEIVHCSVANRENEPVWGVTKSSDPPSGTSVERGDTIDYTLSVQHVSGPGVSDLVIEDDISQLAPYVDFEGFIGTQPAEFSWDDDEPGKLWLKVDQLDPGETLDLVYRVTVRDDADPGAVLRNHVLTNCPPAQPPVTVAAVPDAEPDPCVTEHPTPGWELWKTADPASGSTVYPGHDVVYTLHAYNFSQAEVSGATAVDDLSDVLDDASLVEPLDPQLELDGTDLTWSIPDLAPGEEAEVSFTVTVADDAWGETLHNVVTPDGVGECPAVGDDAAPLVKGEELVLADCETDHEVAEPDVRIEKLWSHDEGENPVDSGDAPPDVISYTLNVWNDGDAVVDPVVTDTLPEGVTFVPGSEVLPAGWTLDDSVQGELTFSYTGEFGSMAYPGVTITFDVEVGELAQPDPTVPIPNLVNTACVAAEVPPPPEEPVLELAPASLAEIVAAVADEEPDPDGPLADCDEAETPVKSIALDGFAQCLNDTPWFSYAITPSNLDTLPDVALIWWTPDAFAGHDPSIPAGDEAAILADGASQVDYVTVPPGWQPGDTISGAQLWPGAEVDAEGNPTDWPGWTLLPNGTWVLDPSAPFYDLRNEAVVEIRVNPSTDTITAYPPATPDCNAAPTNSPKPPKPTPSGMASTGFDQGWLLPLAAGLLAVGALGVWFVARRQRRDDAG